MKFFNAIILVGLAIVIMSCSKKAERPLPAGFHGVEVKEKIDAGDYTYLNVKDKGQDIWIAVTKMPVEKGDSLFYDKAMEMKNWKSDALKRTFESVWFVESVSKQPPAVETGAVSNPHANVAKIERKDVKVAHLNDGKTVEQIFSDKDKLKNKVIKIRGVVTKINTGILDRNWIHIQDGTGLNDSFDLLITSKENAAVGKTIVAEGTVAVDKNFGSGYAYPVMIEDAKIKVE